MDSENNMDFESLVIELVMVCAEDDVLILGKDTLEQLVHDTMANRQSVLQSYSVPEYGHSMNIYETIAFIVIVIQGVESTISLMNTLREKGVSSDLLIDSANNVLKKMYNLTGEGYQRIHDILNKWSNK